MGHQYADRKVVICAALKFQFYLVLDVVLHIIEQVLHLFNSRIVLQCYSLRRLIDFLAEYIYIRCNRIPDWC